MATTNNNNTATVAVQTLSDAEMTLLVMADLMEHAIRDLVQQRSQRAADKMAEARLIVLDGLRDAHVQAEAETPTQAAS